MAKTQAKKKAVAKKPVKVVKVKKAAKPAKKVAKPVRKVVKPAKAAKTPKGKGFHRRPSHPEAGDAQGGRLG